MMTMSEGDGVGKVERRQMWQWMAAQTADAAIEGSCVIGCCWCRRTVMATGG